MIVNTETHNWSEYREEVSVRSSTTAIYLYHTPSQDMGNIPEQ